MYVAALGTQHRASSGSVGWSEVEVEVVVGSGGSCSCASASLLQNFAMSDAGAGGYWLSSCRHASCLNVLLRPAQPSDCYIRQFSLARPSAR